MSFEKMRFNPADGLLDRTAFPSHPVDEQAARMQFQTLFNQLRDALNVVSGSLSGKTVADCGARSVGSAPMFGLDGDNVYDQLVCIKRRLDSFAENPGDFGEVSFGEVSDKIDELTAKYNILLARSEADKDMLGTNCKIFRISGVFVVPYTKIYKVTAVGGGGAGMSVSGASSGQYVYGGGGGGGGTAIRWLELTAGEDIPVTIGAGGLAVTGEAVTNGRIPGNDGGTTAFGTYLSATGGCGAKNSSAIDISAETSVLDGESGGEGIGGDVNINGTPGIRTAKHGYYSTQALYFWQSVVKSGGDSLYGTGGRRRMNSEHDVKDTRTGVMGSGYGAGGGGAIARNQSAIEPAAAGTSGIVIIE